MNKTDIISQLNSLLTELADHPIVVVDESGNETNLSISFFSINEKTDLLTAWCQYNE